MPIYEYHCEDCGTDFEKLVRGAADGVRCPSCGEGHLELRLSTFAAHGGARQGPGLPACPSGMCRTPDLCGRN